MSDFGHFAHSGPKFHIDTWGAGPFLIRVDGKQYRFEDSDRFGPYVLRRDLEIRVHQPGEKHRFWVAYSMWRKGGRILKRGIVAKWNEPKLGTYWKDSKDQLHFITDPDLPTDGLHVYIDDYEEVSRPNPKKNPRRNKLARA